MATERRSTRKRTNWPSLAFGALALVLAAIAIYLAVRGNDAEQIPPAPPAAAGHNEVIHVVQALRDQGLTAQSVPRGVPVGTLNRPGQGVTVDDTPLYVFVYPDAASAEQAASTTDPATILPARSASGTPIATGVPHVASHSNIIVALVGGSDDLRRKVDQAIQGLP